MHKIAFVDDEQNILDGLRRMLRGHRKEWDMQFFDSGNDCLKALESTKFDVIVSDMRMPNMDGAELLTKVSKISPATVRIALSGFADVEMTLEGIHATHQFIAKPATSEVIANTIKRVLETHAWLSHDDIKEKLGSIENLPILPEIYDELMQEIASEEGSIHRVAKIISADVSLSAVLLKVVNSAFFGLVRHVESLEQAATLLGMNTIKNLALQTCVFSSFDGNQLVRKKIAGINVRSQKIGMLCSKLAKVAEVSERSKDHAQIAGMLSGIGELIVESYPEVSWEDCVSRGDSPLVGGYLLSIWNLPLPVIEAVRWHKKPSDSGIDELMPLTVLHAGWSFLHNFEDTGSIALGRAGCDDEDYLMGIMEGKMITEWVDIAGNYFESLSNHG